MVVHGKRITSNEYYGALNRRFDRRASLLRRLGYKYTATVYGGMFVKQQAKHWQTTSIPASIVMVSHNRDFIQTLRQPCTIAHSQIKAS